jgi:hypothetical protein
LIAADAADVVNSLTEKRWELVDLTGVVPAKASPKDEADLPEDRQV